MVSYQYAMKKSKFLAKAKRAIIPKTAKKEKPAGKVIHYYGDIKVAIVKFNRPVKKGTEIHLEGATTNFSQKIESMQFDHKPIAAAKKGQQVGIKVKKKTREGDLLYINE